MSIFLSNKEKAFIDSITKEVINEVIQQSVILFKINPNYSDTESDFYGETSNKIFYPGVKFYGLVEFLEPDVMIDGDGLDQTREITIHAQKENLKDLDIFPEEGDFVYWDEQYFEIMKTPEPKLLQGLPDKKITIEIVAKSTDLSTISIQERI